MRVSGPWSVVRCQLSVAEDYGQLTAHVVASAVARLLDHVLAAAYTVRDEVLGGKLPLRVDTLLLISWVMFSCSRGSVFSLPERLFGHG